MVINLNRENKNVPINPVKEHTLETHNYYIKRGSYCPYCRLGSKPVPKTKIIEKLGKSK